ncbi:MAG: hypothetical protein D6767_01450 [Candidatus Hydrogenedentota bacterium]|nr:MAG: hypothetical protein D6767_01450 [Candidatus Hydrogenedentota bacterium]
MKKLKLLFTMITVISFGFACQNKKSDNSSEDTAVISNGIDTSVNAVNDAMSDLNSANGGGNITLLIPKDWQRKTLLQKVSDSLNELFSANAAAVNCGKSGTYDNTGGQWGTSASFTVTRTFTDCSGILGLIQVNGTVSLAWSSLSTTSPYVQSGTALTRTPNLTITRVATGNYIQVSGSQTLNWTSVSGNNRTLTFSSNITRTAYQSSGTKLFTHNVTTPTNLTILVDLSAGTRTIQSGTTRVQNTETGATLETTFNNVVLSRSNCLPQSGSATFTFSVNGRSGNGSVQFSSGKATYSYSGEKGTVSGTVTLEGCATS